MPATVAPCPHGGWPRTTADQLVRASTGSLRSGKGIGFKEITDGLSKTFLIGEVGGNASRTKAGLWSMAGNSINFRHEVVRYTNLKINDLVADKGFESGHQGGANSRCVMAPFASFLTRLNSTKVPCRVNTASK